MLFFFLGGHFLLSASELGGWTREDDTRKAAKALNDVSLSMPEKFTAPQLPIESAATSSNGQMENLDEFQLFRPISSSLPRRSLPLSAPARGSVTYAL